jgi:hypothetical protein
MVLFSHTLGVTTPFLIRANGFHPIPGDIFEFAPLAYQRRHDPIQRPIQSSRLFANFPLSLLKPFFILTVFDPFGFLRFLEFSKALGFLA